jgi:hypothetical protein
MWKQFSKKWFTNGGEVLLVILGFVGIAFFLKSLFWQGHLWIIGHDEIHFPMRSYFYHLATTGGDWMPRWSIFMNSGYGYLFFNFYGPLNFSIVDLLVHFRLGITEAWNLWITVAYWLSGLGMYLLLRLYVPRIPAFCGALLFVFFPFHLSEIFTRSDPAQAIAAYTFPPFFCYFVVKFLRTEKLHWLIGAILAFNGTVLGHTLSGLMWIPVQGLFVLWAVFYENPKRKTLFALLLAGILALGLASFYLVPLVLEKSLVRIENAFSSLNGHFLPKTHLLPDAFDLSYNPDALLLSPHMYWKVWPLTIGIVGILIGGLLALWSRKIQGKVFRFFIFWVILAVGVLFMVMSSWSVWFWENIPLIYALQFAWRLEALLAFCVAVMGGVLAFQFFRDGKHNFLAKLTLIGGYSLIAWVAAQPYLKETSLVSPTHTEYHKKAYFDVGDIRKNAHYFKGYTSDRREYEPLTVPQDFIDALGEKPWADHSVIRVENPDIIGINRYWKEGNQFQYFIDFSHVTQQAYIDHYYFPGWQVRVNGITKVNTYPTAEGLIGFDMPIGKDFYLTIKFEDSPLHFWTKLVSGIVLSILFLSLFFMRRLNWVFENMEKIDWIKPVKKILRGTHKVSKSIGKFYRKEMEQIKDFCKYQKITAGKKRFLAFFDRNSERVFLMSVFMLFMLLIGSIFWKLEHLFFGGFSMILLFVALLVGGYLLFASFLDRVPAMLGAGMMTFFPYHFSQIFVYNSYEWIFALTCLIYGLLVLTKVWVYPFKYLWWVRLVLVFILVGLGALFMPLHLGELAVNQQLTDPILASEMFRVFDGQYMDMGYLRDTLPKDYPVIFPLSLGFVGLFFAGIILCTLFWKMYLKFLWIVLLLGVSYWALGHVEFFVDMRWAYLAILNLLGLLNGFVLGIVFQSLLPKKVVGSRTLLLLFLISFLYYDLMPYLQATTWSTEGFSHYKKSF